MPRNVEMAPYGGADWSWLSEDKSRLVTFDRNPGPSGVNDIVASLREDQVVLIQNVDPDGADSLMEGIASALDLLNALRLQAAFASSLGHRQNVRKYYMTVNKRKDYQFVAAHSEGSSFTNMQLSSFYCYENSTDGGLTILMNIDERSEIWPTLRERAKKGRARSPLTASELRKIKAMYRLTMPDNTLADDDEILSQKQVDANFTLYDVLTRPRRTFSLLLNRNVYAYWDSIERLDLDSAEEYYNFLINQGLLKLPPAALDIKALDDSAPNRIGRLGSRYRSLFKRKLSLKLQPGDFIIQNNLTWCHSVSNWTPGSGKRMVVAAFA